MTKTSQALAVSILLALTAGCATGRTESGSPSCLKDVEAGGF